MELNHNLFHYERNALPIMLQSLNNKTLKIYNILKVILRLAIAKNTLSLGLGSVLAVNRAPGDIQNFIFFFNLF